MPTSQMGPVSQRGPVQQAAPAQSVYPPQKPNVATPANKNAPEERAADRNLPDASPPPAQDIQALEQQPIHLFDEQKLEEGRSLLNKVLTASVVKVQEYPVDLPTVLKLVEKQNLFLQDSTINAKVENNRFFRSVSDLLPDVTGTYNQSRFQGAIQIFGSQTLQVFQTRLVPQATASWVINPGGRDVFTALAFKQRAREAKYLLNQTLQEQLTQATIEYYELIAAGVNVANVRANIQEVQSQVALNAARLKAGVGTKLDLERARSQLIEREQELITAENTLAKAQQNLLSRLNLDPDVALLPPQVRAEARILIPLNVDTQQLVDRAMEKNPTLKAIQQEIRALGYEGKAVLADAIPTVTLQAYINGTGPEIDKLGLGRFGGFAVQSTLFNGLGTTLPLDYRTRRLLVAQQKVRLKEQERLIQTDVINAFLDSRAGAKSIFTAQELLGVAEEAYRLSFGRYKAGLGINVDVLNAQTALALARVRVVRAIFDFNEAQVRLLKAVGEVTSSHILNGMKADAFTQKTKSP
ncbi:TolC family protein [Vampirovibrio chlorellavorus]|uniref:TolC family protein n=1 Tax=Vampirovibrio chlorellavorus TaxID=758823 RepID=UPI0026F2208B|nr:TolC family protein [Vampirovibrio chlorellavorus]